MAAWRIMMSKYTEQAKVVRQEILQDGIYSLILETDKIAEEARPGQFISLYTHDGSKLLPRPIRDRKSVV